MPDQFAQPIPGQSLTDTPRNAPWERPPEMVDPAQLVEYYIKKLGDEEVQQDLGLVFELVGDLRSTTEALMLVGTQQGVHTTEVGMLIAPIIGSYIKVIMTELGVPVKETNRDLEAESTERENKRITLSIKDALEKATADGETSGILEEMQTAAEPAAEMAEPEVAAEEEVEMETKPMGLMSRGNV